MRFKRYALMLAGAGALLLALPGPIAASGATVIIQRDGSDCSIGRHDIPGVPVEFSLPSSTVVITPTGALNVTCTGRLPDGFTLAQTFEGTVTCEGDVAIVQGHIVATRSGQVMIACHFPAP